MPVHSGETTDKAVVLWFVLFSDKPPCTRRKKEAYSVSHRRVFVNSVRILEILKISWLIFGIKNSIKIFIIPIYVSFFYTCRMAGHRDSFCRLQRLSLLTPSRPSVCPRLPLLSLLLPYALSLSKFAFTKSKPPCSRRWLASKKSTMHPLWAKIRLLDRVPPLTDL
jgi:hypothetical protein